MIEFSELHYEHISLWGSLLLRGHYFWGLLLSGSRKCYMALLQNVVKFTIDCSNFMLLIYGRPLYVYTVLSVVGTSSASISRSSFLTLLFSQWHHINKESLFLLFELFVLTHPQAQTPALTAGLWHGISQIFQFYFWSWNVTGITYIPVKNDMKSFQFYPKKS